jgi:hypothetical protein
MLIFKPGFGAIHNSKVHLPFKDEAQTALFKDPVRTTL